MLHFLMIIFITHGYLFKGQYYYNYLNQYNKRLSNQQSTLSEYVFSKIFNVMTILDKS